MLLDSIISTTQQAHKASIFNEVVIEDPDVSGANEFLFFVKPELLLNDPTLNTRQILEMVLDKIEAFDLKIKNVRVLSAGYLQQHKIIAQHYGVINLIASDAKNAVSDAAKQKFEILFERPFNSAPVFGGLEILEKYPSLTAEGLDYLWQNVPFQKLAGGTYVAPIKIDGEPIYLLNGFHARQLKHFTQGGRCIIALTLIGNIDWCSARGDFIGATCPTDANPGSIRRTLLDNTAVFGLKAVTPSWNGVHLSAGPVEGLVELIRYQSNYESEIKLSAADFSFGQQLIALFGEAKTNWILSNPNVNMNGESISIFDLTEEKNSSDALEILNNVID